MSLILAAALLMLPMAGLVAPGAALLVGSLVLAVARAALARRAERRSAALGGVSLGVSPSGRTVRLTEHELAAHALIVGASGAGKSTTLLSVLGSRIRAGSPVVVLDMKGSPTFAEQLRRAAGAAGRGLRVWTIDGPAHWNPLAHGNPTAIKDRLISTERFTEPHYKRAAERYVQTALQVLHAAHPDHPARLDEVVGAMDPRVLMTLLRRAPDDLRIRVQDYLAALTGDQQSAVRGLATRLALLTESNAGQFLTPSAGPDIDLGAALSGGDVVLFSLNSSVYESLAAQLGAFVIQDLNSATGRRLDASAANGGRPPPQAFVAIDEFSALGADNVLPLLARGREFGVSVLLATQELADLERAGAGFRDQVLGITAVKIAHRQDVYGSAVAFARMAGTERVCERTEQLGGLLGGGGPTRGTRRQVEQLIVHPNEIMALEPGQAVALGKLPRARVARVRVTPSRAAARDQPDPGVTR